MKRAVRSEGIPVELIVVHDDVALNGSGSITGPRGLAGYSLHSQNRGSLIVGRHLTFCWQTKLRTRRR